MAILIDAPVWPFRDRLWSHLVSDVSYAELHDFAGRLALPERAFHRDHYDVPAERHAEAVALGARSVSGREVLAALRRAGLRQPGPRRPRPAGQPPDQPASRRPDSLAGG
ncbi:MAG: DUF4031 domain-containing protein [Actinomycetota bacterium]|nr:DUF4031 domain-containing protein [Actinomycetota bacterium]